MNLNVKDFSTDISGALTSVTTLDNTKYYTGTSEPLIAEDNKTVTIMTNTSTEIEPSSGYTAMKKVTVTTEVPSQLITPPSWYTDGLDSVPTSGVYIGIVPSDSWNSGYAIPFVGDGESTITELLTAAGSGFTFDSLTFLSSPETGYYWALGNEE